MKILLPGVLALCLAASGAAAQNAIGVAPVYDGGGDSWGPVFTQYLTLYTFQELQSDKSLSPSLLNPGGVYTPLDTSWLVDYTTDRQDLNLLLVTTLKPVVTPERGKWTLSVDVALLDKTTGEQRDAWTVSTEIKGKDTDVFNNFKETNPFKLFTAGYRTFDKGPLGKAAGRLAASIHDGVQTRLHITPSPPAASASAGTSCPMHVRITYNYRHAASQAYSLFANGLDESTSLDSGVASFQAPEGPMLVQFSVNDAPYKLASQSIYQLSTIHSCARTTYIVDLSKGGDAHDRWE